MSSGTSFARLWIAMLGSIVWLGVLLFGLILVVEVLPIALWIGLLLAGMLVWAIALFLGLRAASSPRAYRELRTMGLRMPAQVLEIERTKWRKKRGASSPFEAERVVAWQHKLLLRIEHPERGSYEVTHFAYLPTDTKLKRRARVEVLVHPQQPEVLALADEEPS